MTSTKRAKLSGAFSSVPVPPVSASLDSNFGATVRGGVTNVFMLPPTLSKFDSSLPAAPLNVNDSKGAVVTIEQSKRPPFTFASPVIDGKPVAGFAYQGYSMVAGGDGGPATGSFGHAADVRSKFNLKNGRLYVARDKMARVTADPSIKKPMVAAWGEDKQIPLTVLASNTNAFFQMPSFLEAQTEVAKIIEIGATDAIRLVTVDQPKKTLDVESAIITSPLPYLPYFDRYVMLLNPSPSSGIKYAATVIDIADSVNGRPLSVKLQHATKDTLVVDVQIWPSTLEESGIPTSQLRSIPLVAFIDASLDPWGGVTKLMITALAAPPPQMLQWVAFHKSPAIKAHFNDVGLVDSKEAKSRETSVTQLLMNEGRAVPLKFSRAGVANTLLIGKAEAVRSVKNHAAIMARENPSECTSGVLNIVSQASSKDIADSLEELDEIPGFGTVTALMNGINEKMDDAADGAEHANMVCAATFLHALLAGGKAVAGSLLPMVYGWKMTEDTADKDESDFEGSNEKGHEGGDESDFEDGA